MNFKKLLEELENSSHLQRNFQPVILKTLLENKEMVVDQSLIEKELEIYNSQVDIPNYNIGIDVLKDKNIIEKDQGKIKLNLEKLSDSERLKLICACNKIIYFSGKPEIQITRRIDKIILVQGPGENWETSIENLPIRWGVKENSLVKHEWDKIEVGDLVLCRRLKDDAYAVSNKECFVFGVIKEKNIENNPFWEKEVQEGNAIWNHRVVIDPVLYFDEEGSGIKLPEDGSGVNFMKAFYKIDNENLLKSLKTQIEEKLNMSNVINVNLKNEEPKTLKVLIKEFDLDRNYFHRQRMNDNSFTTKLKKFNEKYFENKKIDKLTAETYGSGSPQTENFCDDLKVLLEDTNHLRIDLYGFYYKNGKIVCHKDLYQKSPITQIKVDLQLLQDISDKTSDNVVEFLKNNEMLITKKASTQILFLLNPEKFLSIVDKDTLRNGLRRFGINATETERIKLQDKLLVKKASHNIMKGWTNYDFSFFLECLYNQNNVTKYALCKFTKGLNGEIGSTYKFFNSDEDYVEIQNGIKIIFYDVDDKVGFWGVGEVNNVKFGDSDGDCSISEFEAYGIGEAKTITSLSEPLGVLTDEIDAKVNQKYNLKNKGITIVDDEMFEEIRKELEKEKPFDDLPLPLPSDAAITTAIEEINKELLIDGETIKRIIAALYSGKSILLTGPIGCGKTELAQKIPKIAWADYNGYYGEVVTATNDWTTQNVIGGIVPKLVGKNGDKQVQFIVEKGVAAKTASENWEDGFGDDGKRHQVEKDGRKYRGIWLIIDEFNRADIDKAFGGLLTSLEYRKEVGIKIPTNRPDVLTDKIVVPQDYRIIGTLNTKDKNKLFGISDALNRRFQTIEIFPPPFEKNMDEMEIVANKIIKELEKSVRDELDIDDWSELTKKDSDTWKYLVYGYSILSFIRRYNNLGTAILMAIYKFILVFRAMKNEEGENYSFDDCLDFALLNVVLPQIEKLPPIQLKSINDFSRGRIANNFYKNDFDDDFNSHEVLVEIKKLIDFINMYKENDELDQKKWGKFFNGKMKSERDEILKNYSDVDKEKFSEEQLEPWKSIIEYFAKKGGIDKDSERPVLKRFTKSLQNIIDARTLEDYDIE